MIELMKLEIEKNAIRAYMYAGIIVTIAMIGLLYLFAYAPHIEPNDPDMLIFTNYTTVIGLYSVVNMAVFCVFSCVIYTQFIIEAYKGKQLILLFSYPINRKKMLMAKLAVVAVMTSIFMLICNLIVFSIFSATESWMPILADTFSIAAALHALKVTLIMIIAAVSLSIIATGIGFYTKSVPSTIVAGVILSSLYCNIAFHSLANDTVLLIAMMIAAMAGAATTIILMNQVNKLEVLS